MCALIGIHTESNQMPKLATTTAETRQPRAGETEKMAVNMGVVDLGQVDLLVQEGFYSNRSDLVRTAVRNQLTQHADVLKQTVARRSLTHGNHPFGAILVDRDGNVLIETENGYMPAHDGTAHAERLLATQACTMLTPDVLKGATLYSSAEPCAMCAGAIYWAGIGRLVYGLSEHRLRAVTGNHPENPTLDLPCREVFRSGQRATEVVGPMLEDEAAALHEGVWNK